MLHHDQHLTHLHLLVLLEDVDGLGIIGHGLCHDLRGVGIHLDAAEELAYLRLDMIDVNIADNDDGLIVGSVPLVVVGA